MYIAVDFYDDDDTNIEYDEVEREEPMTIVMTKFKRNQLELGREMIKVQRTRTIKSYFILLSVIIVLIVVIIGVVIRIY